MPKVNKTLTFSNKQLPQCPHGLIDSEIGAWADLHSLLQAPGAAIDLMEMDARTVQALQVISGEIGKIQSEEIRALKKETEK